MLTSVVAILRKDLALSLSRGQGLVQAVLLGLLLIFLFSLSRPTGTLTSPQAAAAIFWLASSFGLVLVFNTLYSLEEENGARLGLLLSPVPLQSVWLGKALAGLVLLACSQVVFAPAAMVFLGQDVVHAPLAALAGVLVIDWGLVVLGSLLGALSQGAAARESLLSVILFPLLLPVLLAGIRIGAAALGGVSGDSGWMGLALAFDALFTGAALVLFPFVYGGDA
ncbi:MAG: heme exporter protein CcmB [Desulfovibrio sp.]|uniref:heme exporter protein CcmB n=1 Tax=Desulfovibrio sp. 7SRBS1 TaxID=3378064 RepID=UPI003B3D24E5